MKTDDKVTLLRTALVSMLPKLRLADMHLGLCNHMSLENKARIALDRSGDPNKWALPVADGGLQPSMTHDDEGALD